MTRTPLRVLLVSALVASFGLSACDDTDDGTPSTTSSETPSTDRDRDRDRDQLRDAADAVADACRDRDQDRLRDRLQDRLRDEDLATLWSDTDALQVEIGDIELAGDTATVRVRLVHGDVTGSTVEQDYTWQFRWENGWRLSELPVCDPSVTPATVRDQTRDTVRDETEDADRDQDRDQDREHTATS